MNAQDSFRTVALVVLVMAAVALIEATVPLFTRPTTLPGRKKTNLAMTFQTLLFALFLTSVVAAAAVYPPLASLRPMAAAGLPAAVQLVLGLVAIDFAFGYAAHRTMHASLPSGRDTLG